MCRNIDDDQHKKKCIVAKKKERKKNTKNRTVHAFAAHVCIGVNVFCPIHSLFYIYIITSPWEQHSMHCCTHTQCIINIIQKNERKNNHIQLCSFAHTHNTLVLFCLLHFDFYVFILILFFRQF